MECTVALSLVLISDHLAICASSSILQTCRKDLDHLVTWWWHVTLSRWCLRCLTIICMINASLK